MFFVVIQIVLKIIDKGSHAMSAQLLWYHLELIYGIYK